MKPHQLFAAFYPRQCTLIDYLSDIEDRLHLIGDNKTYNDMLKHTIVCYYDNQVDLCSFTPRVREGFHMRDVIQRVIEMSCHSLSGSAGNVISIGYQLVRDRNNSTGCTSSTATVVNKYPNSIVEFLSSKCWQVLHKCIGDDLMIHLLKDVSLFVMVKNTCYMQVAGCPMYNLDYMKRVEQETQGSAVVQGAPEDVNMQQQADVVPQESTILQLPLQNIPFQQEFRQDMLPHQQIYPQNPKAQQTTNVQEDPARQKTMVHKTAISLQLTVQQNNFVQGVQVEETAISQQQQIEQPPLPMECSVIEEIPQSVLVHVSNSHAEYVAIQTEESSVGNGELKEQTGRSKKATKRKRENPRSLKEPTAKKARCLNSERLKLKTNKPKDRSTNFCSNISNLYFPQPALMYSTNHRNRFPNRHILSSTSASKRGAIKLIEAIFIESNFVFDNKTKQTRFVAAKKTVVRKNGVKDKKNQRVPKRFVRMKGLFERILKRHKKCRFNALLKHHCKGMVILTKENKKTVGIQETPVEIQKNRNSNGEKVVESQDKVSKIQENLHKKRNIENKIDGGRKVSATKQQQYDLAVQNFTPPFQVVRFITAVCNKVVPKDLWGSPQNKKAFYNNLKGFITLNKGEKYSLGQVVHGIKLKDCDWLQCTGRQDKGVPLSESAKQREVFYKWMWWFVRRYIMVIIKTFFYVTENAGPTRDIFFYRKPVWKVINDFGVATMKTDLLKPLTEEEAQKILRSNSSLGYSYMRFLPKAQTVRPIINMKHPPLGSNSDQRFQASINSRLRNLFEIIKYEKSREPVGSDSTVFGNDDVYQALSAFHSKRKERHDERSLCMVHVDINKCFDSIPFEKLYGIMEDVFKEEEYIVRKFALIKSVNNSARKVFNRKVSSGEDCRSFKQFLEDMIQEKNLNNVIFIDQVYYSCEDRDNILVLLRKHLFDNIVKIGSKFYKQIKGIAQGSILSTYLCSYFYSHMEKRYLRQQMHDQSSLLMRWVDDFLLLSPTKAMADAFLRIMLAGIPEYGCQMTPRKTLVNYEATVSDGIPVRYVGQDEAFPWCGFLIHPKSLETKLDSSRYEGKNKKNSVLRNLHSHPGRNLLEKLRYSLLNKCHPLLLDTVINSRRTVLLNIYEAFFRSACKFYNYCRDFTKGRQIQDNPSFCMRVIMALPQFFCAQANLKFKKLKLNARKPTRRHGFDVGEGVVTWLCCRAYVGCLKKKPSFKLVVKALRKRIRNLAGKHTNLPQSIFNPLPVT